MWQLIHMGAKRDTGGEKQQPFQEGKFPLNCWLSIWFSSMIVFMHVYVLYIM